MHPRLGRLALAVGFGVACSSVATAATLRTAPASAFVVNKSGVFCQMRNIGTEQVTATVDGIDINGLVKSSIAGLVVAPGVAVSHPGGSVTSCRFTIDRSPKSVRAVALYWDGARYRLAVPAR